MQIDNQTPESKLAGTLVQAVEKQVAGARTIAPMDQTAHGKVAEAAYTTFADEYRTLTHGLSDENKKAVLVEATNQLARDGILPALALEWGKAAAPCGDLDKCTVQKFTSGDGMISQVDRPFDRVMAGALQDNWHLFATGSDLMEAKQIRAGEDAADRILTMAGNRFGMQESGGNPDLSRAAQGTDGETFIEEILRVSDD